MSYLAEFKTQINNRDIPKFFQLWEEYCTNDVVDVEELLQLLQMIKNSDMSKPFGGIVETAIPVLNSIADPKSRYAVLRLLIDLETTNSPALADLTYQTLKDLHGNHPQFNERIRLVGLRTRENFQGAISHFDLLAHMEVGKFVFHQAGWGTGEIMEISPLREQVGIEFENVSGRKHITFANAFKSLVPIQDDNFLARRFADADALEQEARDNAVAVIKMLLRDLGPKNAAEIKDDMCELVIPEKDWTKWWQGARAKIKKDPLIETPENLKDPFRLRKAELTQEERLNKAIKNKTGPDEVLLSTYNFMRDLPNARKHQDVTQTLLNKTLELLQLPDLTKEQELQIYMLLETMFGYDVEAKKAENLIKRLDHVEEVVNGIEILALKKRALVLIRDTRKDWVELFLNLMFSIPQSALRDYILKELNQGESKKILVQKLEELARHPMTHPDFVVWYFQKIVSDGDDIPFADKAGQCLFFEAFLILYSYVENKPEYKDLTKKMYTILSGKRYEIVRKIIEGTDVAFIKEFLLLVSKCQSLSDHDMKNLRSLAEVVHPSVGQKTSQKVHKHMDGNTLWTTEEGYLRVQDRIKTIATKEMIENAREVEAARALGDLRENSEYKFAVERRHRLQGEMKTLSEQLNRARILTIEDIIPGEVGVGCSVNIQDQNGKKLTYTILGPWEANVDENILSFQSKFAQAMFGLKEGDSFHFKDEEYTIEGIKSFFEK